MVGVRNYQLDYCSEGKGLRLPSAVEPCFRNARYTAGYSAHMPILDHTITRFTPFVSTHDHYISAMSDKQNRLVMAHMVLALLVCDECR